MQSSGAQGARNCVECGRSISWDANVCPYCGHDYRTVMMPVQKKESTLPVAGGVLIMIAALGYLVVGGFMLAGSAVISMMIPAGGTAAMAVCGSVAVVLGVVSILGGIFAIRRQNFPLALIGGILVIPSILGLIGMILVAVSHQEFR